MLRGLKPRMPFWRSEVPDRLHWARSKVLAGPDSFQRLQGRPHPLTFSSFERLLA